MEQRNNQGKCDYPGKKRNIFQKIFRPDSERKRLECAGCGK
jgi:hypothetical protein